MTSAEHTPSIIEAPKKIGLLLINLGTPDDPEPKQVAKYLREFLMDPLVINMPELFRWFLVNLIIVPFRSKKSSHAYKSIWSQKGSPLMFHTKSLCEEVSQILGKNYVVQFAMRYGRPPIARCFRKFMSESVECVVVIPLYPQYAESTTLSSIKVIREVLKFAKFEKPVKILREFYQVQEFIDAETEILRQSMGTRNFDHFVFSFHGLPVSHITKVAPESKDCLTNETCKDLCNPLCYRGQCYLTAKSIARQLGLAESNYTVTFQSRLGRQKWLTPSTEETVINLAGQGKKNIFIASPSFSTDCLETLEELGIQLRECFLKAGGENLHLAPCLNAKYEWSHRLAEIVQRIEKDDPALKEITIAF